MKKARLVCMILAFLIGVFPLLITGCAEKGGDNVIEDIDTEGGELPPVFDGEQHNYNGATFKVMTDKPRTATQAFNIVDLVVEDNLGDDAIKVAVDRRNERIRKNFGVKIERVLCSGGYSYEDAATNIQKGDYETANVYMVRLKNGLDLAKNGTLVDFNYDVEYIDLNEPWWDSAIIDSLLLYGGAYFCLGDINTVDNDATWCVLFNKMLWESLSNKESSVLYEKVKEGNGKAGGWTTELMKLYAKQYFRDDMNSSVPKWNMSYTGNGTYGLYTQADVASVLMQASGNTPTKINTQSALGVKDNITGNDSYFEALNKVFEFMGGTGNDEWMVSFGSGFGSGDIWDTVVRAGFKANKSLFFICHCGSINLMRDMEEPFGILPIPKLTDNQEKYGNTIQYGNATCYIVPYNVNTEMNEMAAYILEAMAYYSSNEFDEYIGDNISLTYAYYDTVLKRKATRDDESWDMLDLVFDNRIFDIACALNLRSIDTLIINNTTGSANNFMSAWESNREALFGEIQNLIANLV